MKPIRWTMHARKKANAREISNKQIEETIALPDAIVPGHPPRQVYMRRYFDDTLQTEMLLRVVVEETPTEITVITLYKTSKIEKYEGGL